VRYRTIAAAGATALCAGLVLATCPGFARPGTTRSTTYAFKSTGYGTRIVGGQLPAGSDTTGYQVIGCTNQAGKHKQNNVAAATVPGLGTVSGIRTRDWTSAQRGVVASHSTHSIADITLADSSVGSLEIDAITSTARSYHDADGFHSLTSTQIGGITFTPPVGQPQTFPAPTPDQPVAIPGLATIYAGKSRTSHNSHDSSADAFALRVDVVPTGTSVRVAHSHSELHDGMTTGIFGGHSAATHVVTAAGDIAKSGPNPLSVMPCQGTYGKVHAKSLARLDLGGQLIVRGASSGESATQDQHGAHGYEKAEIARLDLGGGQLVVTGIVGKASVQRTPHGVVKSVRGTELGTVTANGQVQKFPPTGVLEIPGVAKLERRVVTRSRSGLKVTALRVTLLDGSGAVIDLGEASMRVRRPSQ
jgi:hypothetical protein